MRLGLIGAGRWGKVYIRTIEGLGPRLRLTHLATRRPENRALVKEPVALFSDWKKLIVSDCDAVVIATPAALHAEMTRACLEAGKPCIVEKPLCFDTTTAQALQREAARAGLPVLVNYIHLYNPAVQALKKAIAASGEPIRDILSEGTDLGPFRADVGTLWDRCPHDVALCLDLVGGTGPATSWRTEASAFGGFADPQGRPEMITLRLRWKDGAAAWIQSGRLNPQKRRTLSVITDSTLFHFDDQDRSHCRRIPFDYAGRSRLGSGPLSKEGDPIPVPDRLAPMEAMLTAFADHVQGKATAAAIGLGLTVELTRILEQCQTQLERDPLPNSGEIR